MDIAYERQKYQIGDYLWIIQNRQSRVVKVLEILDTALRVKDPIILEKMVVPFGAIMGKVIPTIYYKLE